MKLNFKDTHTIPKIIVCIFDTFSKHFAKKTISIESPEHVTTFFLSNIKAIERVGMRKKTKNTFLFYKLQLKQTLGGHGLGPSASLMLQQNIKMVGELRRKVKIIQMPEAVRCSAVEVIQSKTTTLPC